MPASPVSASFTQEYNVRVNVLISEVDIYPAFDPVTTQNHPEHKRYNCIWDTGATNTVITKKVAGELGLKPISMVLVKHAKGEDMSAVYFVNVRLLNNVGFANLRVTEGVLAGFDVLIGMDIIGQGDFAITHQDGKTTFSFRTPSMEKIDFVKQYKEHHTPMVADNKVGRNDPCACGSGKKYKKCCGKDNA